MEVKAVSFVPVAKPGNANTNSNTAAATAN
jgi:hypothetical protein